jgi:long-chain acyl-CoA synthetase
MNIAQLLDSSAQHFADRPAILFGERAVSYAALREQVDRVASGLANRGIGAGDRVALFLPNIPEFATVFLAAQKVGAIAVSMNVMLTADEVRYILDDCCPRLLFTVGGLMPAVTPLIGTLLGADQVIICEGAAEAFVSLAAFSADGTNVPFATRAMEPNSPASILYTSGTTGRQKGATLSHANVLSNVHAVREYLRIEPADRLLLFLPLFHCFGQNFIMNAALASGATLVMHRRFETESVLASTEGDRVTMFFAVPTIYISLLNAGVAPARLASVRYFFSAAAALPAEVAERWHSRFGRPIHEGYGLTETSPFATYNHEWSHRPGSQGTSIPLVDISIMDENDQPVPTGGWGEICITGPNVMLGYWNRPAETAEALRGGWFHSGDVGYLDDDGYLYIVDRTKDMINSAGFKIWPREVEEVLYTYAGVQECAVVGVPDSIKGEVAKAYVVAKPGVELAVDQVEAFCRQRLATYKIPREYEFIAEIPKNATGKILKRVLRERPRVGV